SPFTYHAAPHWDLHTFPTRRSSDLGSANSSACTSSPARTRKSSACCRATGAPATVPTSAPSAAQPPANSAKAKGARSPQARARRSEEHTSELQSHLNLVCRLLLEKE